MKAETIKAIRSALQQQVYAAKDDLMRAQAVFRGHDLNEQYGYTGMIKREVLKGYEDRYATATHHLDDFEKGMNS